jgi:hypothetical protein
MSKPLASGSSQAKTPRNVSAGEAFYAAFCHAMADLSYTEIMFVAQRPAWNALPSRIQVAAQEAAKRMLAGVKLHVGG